MSGEPEVALGRAAPVSFYPLNTMQKELDFTATPHNNRESTLFYEDNMKKFSGQCKQVLHLLRKGYRLSVYEAVTKWGIFSLPRRVKDLKDAGFDIKDEWAKDEGGKRAYKVYYIQ